VEERGRGVCTWWKKQLGRRFGKKRSRAFHLLFGLRVIKTASYKKEQGKDSKRNSKGKKPIEGLAKSTIKRAGRK